MGIDINQSIDLDFDYQNKHYEGETVPSSAKQSPSSIPAFDIYLDNEYNGAIVKSNDQWISDIRTYRHYDMCKLLLVVITIKGCFIASP